MTPLALEWVSKAEEDFEAARWLSQAPTGTFNVIGFHAQQCVEKYLKARLTDAGIPFPRTHDLAVLVNLILPVEPSWAVLHGEIRFLTPFSVEVRYPGVSATAQDSADALAACSRARQIIRQSMGLP